jgi:hypothetical protein
MAASLPGKGVEGRKALRSEAAWSPVWKVNTSTGGAGPSCGAKPAMRVSISPSVVLQLSPKAAVLCSITIIRERSGADNPSAMMASRSSRRLGGVSQ